MFVPLSMCILLFFKNKIFNKVYDVLILAFKIKILIKFIAVAACSSRGVTAHAQLREVLILEPEAVSSDLYSRPTQPCRFSNRGNGGPRLLVSRSFMHWGPWR